MLVNEITQRNKFNRINQIYCIALQCLGPLGSSLRVTCCAQGVSNEMRKLYRNFTTYNWKQYLKIESTCKNKFLLESCLL
jgi:hypothetical protein